MPTTVDLAGINQGQDVPCQGMLHQEDTMGKN
jgi:hypothetical protein